LSLGKIDEIETNRKKYENNEGDRIINNQLNISKNSINKQIENKSFKVKNLLSKESISSNSIIKDNANQQNKLDD